MDPQRSFRRMYAINVARLKQGQHKETFEIGKAFFEHFDHSLIQEADIQAKLSMNKTLSHLDVQFHFEGWVELPCDRCNLPYQQPISRDDRIIYSFNEGQQYDYAEVIYVDRDESDLSIIQELYDFVSLALPMRRVPDFGLHRCDPDTLKAMGLDENGDPLPENEEDREIDPRWEALKKLKDQME